MQIWWHLHALKTWSEYMNMHAVNTCNNGESIHAHVCYEFVIKEKKKSVQCFVHMMISMRMNTCMETIHGTLIGCRRRRRYVGTSMH